MYENVELLTEGELARNTLFVLGRDLDPPLGAGDQLLLVDPPDDVRTRFTMPERVAAIATEGSLPAGLTALENKAGGVAHFRVGAQLVDMYGFRDRAVVFLPALGLLCAGSFAQETLPPRLTPGSDGQEELEVLLLLARLVRERAVQLLIPLHGAQISDKLLIMNRLADDVSYIHGLRRTVNALAHSGEGLHAALAVADSLLPTARTSGAARAVNTSNVSTCYAAAINQQN